MRDLVAGVVCAAFGLLTLVWLIPAGVSVPSRVPNPALSPAFWPRILSALLIMAGVWLAIGKAAMLVRAGGLRGTGTAAVPADESLDGSVGLLRPATAIAMLLPYYLATIYLGLLIPSVLAFVFYALLAGERRYLLVIVCGVLLPLGITIFFIRVANILIPVGPLRALF